MPNLETALPGQSIAANRSVRTGRPGLLESLTAPGVSAIVPVPSETAMIARNVLAAVGATAQVAGQIGNIADEQRREIEQENRQAMQEALRRARLGQPADPTWKNQDILRVYDEAAAIRDADVESDRIRQDVANGKYPIGPDEDAAAAVTRIALERSNGRSDTYRDSFNESLRQRAVPLFIEAQQALKKQTADDVFATLNSGMDSADRGGELTEEKAASLIDQAKKVGGAFGLNHADSIAALMPSFRAIANRGGKVESFIEALRDSAPDKAEQLAQMADAARRQQKAVNESDAIRKADELEASGAPLAAYQNFIDRQHKAGAISGAKAQAMTSRYAVSQARLAADRGSYLEVDAIAKHTHAKDADTQLMLKGLHDQAVQRSRKIDIDLMLEDAIRGRKNPLEVIEELGGRRAINKADPENPRGITFDDYRRAVSVLESSLTRMDETMLGVQYVDEALRQPGAIPINAEHASYVEAQWARDGVASVQTVGNKQVFAGVTAPEVAATRSAAMQYVLPAWSKQIGQTMSAAAADSPQLRVAMRSLAALHIQNPNLAMQVRENLSDLGKSRADFLIQEIDRSHALALDNKGQPNREWTDRIGSLVTPMLQVKPVALSKDDTTLALWDTKFDEDVRDAAIRELGKQLPAGLDETKFTFGFGRDVAVSNAAANRYAEYAREEYRALISRGVPDAAAVTTAKQAAGQRLLAKHPPILWNGVVAVGPEAPHPFTAEHETELLGLLREQIKTGKLTESIGFYEENYRPRWNPAAQGGQWTLIDGSGNELDIDGKTVGFRPEVKTTPAYSDAKKSMEAKARERKAVIDRELFGSELEGRRIMFNRNGNYGETGARGEKGQSGDPEKAAAERGVVIREYKGYGTYEMPHPSTYKYREDLPVDKGAEEIGLLLAELEAEKEGILRRQAAIDEMKKERDGYPKYWDKRIAEEEERQSRDSRRAYLITAAIKGDIAVLEAEREALDAIDPEKSPETFKKYQEDVRFLEQHIRLKHMKKKQPI